MCFPMFALFGKLSQSRIPRQSPHNGYPVITPFEVKETVTHFKACILNSAHKAMKRPGSPRREHCGRQVTDSEGFACPGLVPCFHRGVRVIARGGALRCIGTLRPSVRPFLPMLASGLKSPANMYPASLPVGCRPYGGSQTTASTEFSSISAMTRAQSPSRMLRTPSILLTSKGIPGCY